MDVFISVSAPKPNKIKTFMRENKLLGKPVRNAVDKDGRLILNIFRIQGTDFAVDFTDFDSAHIRKLHKSYVYKDKMEAKSVGTINSKGVPKFQNYPGKSRDVIFLRKFLKFPQLKKFIQEKTLKPLNKKEIKKLDVKNDWKYSGSDQDILGEWKKEINGHTYYIQLRFFNDKYTMSIWVDAKGRVVSLGIGAKATEKSLQRELKRLMSISDDEILKKAEPWI